MTAAGSEGLPTELQHYGKWNDPRHRRAAAMTQPAEG